MKSCFLCVVWLFLIFTVISGTFGCDRNTGPAGLTHCVLLAPDYTKYQCGTCLTDAYIRQRSKGKHECEDRTTTYCYYQCMVEKHGLDEGPVYDDCLCDANVALPQPSVILHASCYSPDGTDCNWYSQCLARMFDCTGQANYAIQYGEKYCRIYSQSELAFSEASLQWINAVRKCLQVAFVPLLHLCREQPTCQTIETIAFESHVPCYLSPYQGFSVCLLPASDWLRIFWTIKGSFISSAFLETVKASAIVAANCATDGFRAAFRNILYALDVLLWGDAIMKRSTNDMSDDELAHSIFLHVSSSLQWDQRSTVDWYAFAANTSADENSLTTQSTDQSGKKLRIQVIGLYAMFAYWCNKRVVDSTNGAWVTIKKTAGYITRMLIILTNTSMP